MDGGHRNLIAKQMMIVSGKTESISQLLDLDSGQWRSWSAEVGILCLFTRSLTCLSGVELLFGWLGGFLCSSWCCCANIVECDNNYRLSILWWSRWSLCAAYCGQQRCTGDWRWWSGVDPVVRIKANGSGFGYLLLWLQFFVSKNCNFSIRND